MAFGFIFVAFVVELQIEKKNHRLDLCFLNVLFMHETVGAHENLNLVMHLFHESALPKVSLGRWFQDRKKKKKKWK